MSFFSELKRRNVLRVALACLTLMVLILVGCATPADREKAEAAREKKLANTFGASGTAFSPDGTQVAVGTREKQISHRLTLPVQTYGPRAIAWSESTRMLAYSTGTQGSSVKVVHIGEDGFGPIRDVPGFEGVPTDLQFSRDGRYLADAGDGEGVFIREVETGLAAGEDRTASLVWPQHSNQRGWGVVGGHLSGYHTGSHSCL